MPASSPGWEKCGDWKSKRNRKHEMKGISRPWNPVEPSRYCETKFTCEMKPAGARLRERWRSEIDFSIIENIYESIIRLCSARQYNNDNANFICPESKIMLYLLAAPYPLFSRSAMKCENLKQIFTYALEAIFWESIYTSLIKMPNMHYMIAKWRQADWKYCRRELEDIISKAVWWQYIVKSLCHFREMYFRDWYRMICDFRPEAEMPWSWNWPNFKWVIWNDYRDIAALFRQAEELSLAHIVLVMAA